MSGALDTILAKVMRLTGAPVLFVALGRHCGPGPGVLLMHRAESNQWELPSTDGAADMWLEAAVPLGDSMLARCDSQFDPTLNAHDDFMWVSPGFALECQATHPTAAAAIQQFLAAQSDLHPPGDKQMENRSEFTAAQQKAAAVYQMFGDSAPASLQGERLSDYRVRLVSKFQQHSRVFKDANLARIAAADAVTLTALEDAIYADAAAALHDPATFQPGELRRVVTRDPSGREITKYVGDPNACWDQFNPPIRYVRKFMVPGAR